MDLFEWITTHLHPTPCTSDRFIYDDMDSQSGRALPILYQPFDAARKFHWQDRGASLDFLYATQGEGKRLLDFGPGDGWPSLLIAPDAAEVVGLDASRRRVAVCAENARRLGIGKARFIYLPPGERFPFEENSFDGVTAASSVEQSPDPYETLAEIYRVLKPGGRLRVHYESLNRYRSGQERDLFFWPLDDRRSRLILFNRDLAAEQAVQYGLTFEIPLEALEGQLAASGRRPAMADITATALEKMQPVLLDARMCTTVHPSGRTLVAWLAKIGFREVLPTHSGAWFAGELFEQLPAAHRPTDLAGVDALLQPIIKAVIKMPAPLDDDPLITAVK